MALISCYLNSNTANTILHKYRSRIPRKDTARAVEDLAEREPPSSQVVWGPPTRPIGYVDTCLYEGGRRDWFEAFTPWDLT